MAVYIHGRMKSEHDSEYDPVLARLSHSEDYDSDCAEPDSEYVDPDFVDCNGDAIAKD
jgi:hypothetical protein